MTPLDAARAYLDAVTGVPDLDALERLLDPGCRFRGPFATFDTAAAYVASLRVSPPEGWTCRIVDQFEEENRACLIYQFSKSGIGPTPMAQRFTLRDGRIADIDLIFDTGAFAS